VGSPDIKALLREAMDHLNDPSRYWGCDKASDFERRVNAALATPTPPAPLVHPEVCAFCGIITTDAEPSDGTKYVCRDTQSCIDRARKACGLPPKPAPADDASGAEAMRADFLAWVNAGYLVRDAVTPVEWDDEGLPVYYTRDDGVRHYLDGEWHAWQAARALPLPPATGDATRVPATDDAVEEAMVPGCHEHVALWDAINAYSAACGGHPTRGGGARMDAVVRVEKALRAALRREKGGA